MKRKDFDQLRSSTVESLRDLLKKTQLEALKIKLEISRGKVKNVHASLAKRKEVAKIKTLLREKELNLEQAAKEAK